MQQELSFLRTRVDQNEDRLEQTTARVDHLEETVADDRAKTILLLADHCERLDHHSNAAKSHCVLITGINIKRKQWNMSLVSISVFRIENQ